MADRTILRINNVRHGNITSTANVLSVNEEFVHQIVPRFVPNLYQGPIVNQDHKWREIRVVLDSDTDIFDADYFITAANPAINDFWIEFELAPRCAVIGIPALYTACNINVAARTFTANGGDPYAIFEAGDEVIVIDAENAANNGTYIVTSITGNGTIITTDAATPPIVNNADDETIKICRGTKETWTYAETYLTDRREGRVEEGSERNTYEYDFISLNAKTIHITVTPFVP